MENSLPIHNLTSSQDSIPTYQIKIQGQLPLDWAELFDGMRMESSSDGNTLLTGAVPDQSALHGLLARVRDLGLILLALRRFDAPEL